MLDKEPMLSVVGLEKTYQAKNKPPIRAVNNISFQVKKGTIVGILGPNGAGKTTTIKMLCGLILPDAGAITINGHDLAVERSSALRSVSAVLDGNRNIYWRLTVRENLAFFAALKQRKTAQISEDIEYYLEFFNLKEKRNEEARKLSRGMQQKLAIAVAMIAESDILLLDEPTLGLDVTSTHEIRELLRTLVDEKHKTVLLSTHDMHLVENVCDEVIIINQGRVVVQDSVSNLKGIFQTKPYRILIEGTLSDSQILELSHIPNLSVEVLDTGSTLLTALLEEKSELYPILNILEQEESPVESIEKVTPNFEEIFLAILQKGA